jgi:hypothetical protein
MDEFAPQRMLLYRRVLAGELGLAPVWFDVSVLDRYWELPGHRVIRSNSAGRVQAPAGWSLDFGIAADDQILHTTIDDLTQRLPESERAHWLGHLASLPLSGVFLTMRLVKGTCIDDGEIRRWTKGD